MSGDFGADDLDLLEGLLDLPASREAGEVRLVPRPGPFAPASLQQRRLWFLHQLDPRSSAYNISSAIRLTGAFDRARFVQAFDAVVSRHAALRTTFVDRDGEPWQQVAPVPPASIIWDDWGASPDHHAAIAALIADEGARPFDLARGPLYRVRVVRLAPDEHALLLTVHHIIADAWSLDVLIADLQHAYEGLTLPPLRVQYSDYAWWQRESSPPGATADAMRYWEAALAGLPETTLPTDLRRPASLPSDGAAVAVTVDPAVSARLAALARSEGTTPYVLYLSAFFVLLARYTGQSDLVVGSPIAQRDDVDTQALIGFFVNMLVLRVDASGQPPFRAFLSRVQQVVMDGMEHGEIPYEALVERLRPARDASRNPLFTTAFTLLAANSARRAFGGLSTTPLETAVSSRFDMEVVVSDAPMGTRAVFTFNTALFEHATIECLAASFTTLLAGIAAHPELAIGDLPLLGRHERDALVSQAVTAAPAGTLYEAFERVVSATPSAIAVRCGEQAMTYGELDSRAAALAAVLRTRGVSPDVRVGLALDRSIDLVVGIVGILKAGGAYVPFDPEYPAERLAYMLDDSQVTVVVTRSDIAPALPAHDAELVCMDQLGSQPVRPDVPASGAVPANAAYVIYTSGSTGRPKGVVVCHAEVTRLLSATKHWFGFHAGDVWTLFHSYAFDFSVWEVWGALLHGGTLVVVPRDVARAPEDFYDLLLAERVTVLNQTPSAFRALIEVDRLRHRQLALRHVVFGGEALDLAMLEPWVARHGDEAPRLINMYGITETTVHVTYRPIRRADVHGRRGSVIGGAIPDLELHLLDERLEPVPVGAVGEIYVGGAGVARGYLRRPGLTATRMVANPFGPGRLYRSGDLARRLAGGDLEFAGRADAQVKIRGFRIELSEIEAVLAEVPSVAQVAVVVREDAIEDLRLVAYVVPRGDVDPRALRRHAAARLPDYMVPSAVVTLPALPLTPNGKLNRRALPAPVLAPVEVASRRPPRSDAERRLCAIWADVLGVPEVGVADDFFALGGHSLLATRLVARIRDTFGVDLPLRRVFSHPSPDLMAEAIGEAGAADTDTPVPAVRTTPMPMSSAQQRLWFLDQLQPDTATYNVSTALRLEGDLDVAALARSLDGLVDRHESLRTTFTGEGQWIAARGTVNLELGEWDERAVEAFATRPFDLARGPLLRARLLRRGPGRHVLVLAMHHIVTDAWSLAVLARELGALYAGQSLPPLSLQYADYAQWQRGRDIRAQLAWWRGQLEGLDTGDVLPLDHPRAPEPGGRGAALRLTLQASPLREAAGSHGATLFMVLMAAFGAVLHRSGGPSDLALGVPVANRAYAVLEPLVGFFVNTVVMRLDLSGDPTVGELIARAQTTALDAWEHQEASFDQVVEAVRPDRDRTRHPLFQAMLVVQNTPVETMRLGAVTIAPEPIETATSKFDLTLLIEEQPDRLDAVLEYDASLFDRQTIAALGARLQHLCASFPTGTRLSELSIVPEDERRLVEAWSTGAPLPCRGTLVDLFEAQADLTPDAPAVTFEGLTLSYAQLDEAANRLARRLVDARDVRPDSIVGLCLDRSIEMVVAILGTLKAGAAYLPIDPTYPPDRQAFMVEDSGVTVTLRASDVDLAGGSRSRRAVHPDQSAYVIYTSGSTGRPKGVTVSHANAVASVRARLREYGTSKTTLLVPSFSFDSSVAVIFGALLSGGRLLICPEGMLTDVEALTLLIADEQVSAMLLVPGLYAAVLNNARHERLSSLRTVIVAGEAVPLGLPAIHRTLTPQARLYNEYGPTEASVWSTVARLGDSDELPIGSPIPNAQVHLLDERLQRVPIGAAGEIYIGGAGVARGYRGRPSTTATRFVADPFGPPGGRLYRTGDLARWRHDGQLDFLGRVDQQVKIRGFRVELGEVEAALTRLDGVAEAAVAADHGRLVAYVVMDADRPLDVAGARAELNAELPGYMVPSELIPLPSMPRTPNGKLDRAALAAAAAESRSSRGGVPPRDPLEDMILREFEAVLQRPVGVTDDFFDHGGHSLLALDLVARLRSVCGFDLKIATLFEQPTVEHIARVVRRGVPERSLIVPLQTSGEGIPLFFVHQAGGNVMAYLALARALGGRRPFYGLQARGIDGLTEPLTDVASMASLYIDAVREVQPTGPYCLGGHSMGGKVAAEMVRQLELAGERVSRLVVVDVPGWAEDPMEIPDDTVALTHIVGQIEEHYGCRLGITGLEGLDESAQYECVMTRMAEQQLVAPGTSRDDLRGLLRVYKANVQAVLRHRVSPIHADVSAIVSTELAGRTQGDPTAGWQALTSGRVTVHTLDSTHVSILKRPAVEQIAELLASDVPA